MDPHALRDFLSSKVSNVLTWVSTATGIGSVLGLANLTAALLSAVWIALQIWNFFTYTMPRNRRERESWAREDAANDAASLEETK